MAWIRKRLKAQKVWVRTDPSGNPLLGPDGRADVIYNPGGKVYRAAGSNLLADDDPLVLSEEQARPGPPAEAGKPVAKPAKPAAKRNGSHIGNGALHDKGDVPEDAIHIYTDGACTGNPGPMGIGVVLLYGDERREVSEYLGIGTNNVAELTAILRGLEMVTRDRTVVVYSDSAYALGLLGKGWKAKANQDLVTQLRKVAGEFVDVRLVKVAGHAGVPENERCDELARTAVLNRR